MIYICDQGKVQEISSLIIVMQGCGTAAVESTIESIHSLLRSTTLDFARLRMAMLNTCARVSQISHSMQINYARLCTAMLHRCTRVLERIGTEMDLLDNGACDVLDKLSNAGTTELLDHPGLLRTKFFVTIRVGVELCLDLHMKRERSSERRGRHGGHGRHLNELDLKSGGV